MALTVPSHFGFISGKACDELNSGKELDCVWSCVDEFLSFLYGQVLALVVPSRLEFISGEDWAMISDWQTVGLCWCFALVAFSSDVEASLVIPC